MNTNEALKRLKDRGFKKWGLIIRIPGLGEIWQFRRGKDEAILTVLYSGRVVRAQTDIKGKVTQFGTGYAPLPEGCEHLAPKIAPMSKFLA